MVDLIQRCFCARKEIIKTPHATYGFGSEFCFVI